MKKQKYKHMQLSAESASELYFWTKTMTTALIVLMLVNTFFFRVTAVSGPSMYPTLEHMDQLLLQISGYNTERNPVQRGDIVVAITDALGPNAPIVKRVIGVAGDVIDVTVEGYISINGVVQEEPYISEPIRWDQLGSIEYPYTVTDGYVFVLGDNRNLSLDSRTLGELPCENILGKAVFCFWPFSKFGGMQ